MGGLQSIEKAVAFCDTFGGRNDIFKAGPSGKAGDRMAKLCHGPNGGTVVQQIIDHTEMIGGSRGDHGCLAVGILSVNVSAST